MVISKKVRECECIFVFKDTATTEIYTLSLHDALPISENNRRARYYTLTAAGRKQLAAERAEFERVVAAMRMVDRKSTRLNSSHANISYAVFCLTNIITSFSPATLTP